MSHPPQCEVTRADHTRCENWVDEPGGPGTAVKTRKKNGSDAFVCNTCARLAAAVQREVDGGTIRQRAGAHRIGRNDPCPCNSGRKYKNCHG